MFDNNNKYYKYYSLFFFLFSYLVQNIKLISLFKLNEIFREK